MGAALGLAKRANDALALEQRQIRRLRRAEGWGIVSSRGNNYGHTGRSIATAGTFHSFRVAHTNKTGKTIVAVRLGYAHYGAGGGTEASNTNSIQVKAAMEFEGLIAQTGYRTPAFFNGSRLATIAPRGLVWSEPLSCRWAPDATIYERVGVTVDTNGGSYFRGSYLRGGTTNGGDNTGEGLVEGTDAVDANNTTSTVGNAYSAVAIIGIAEDGSIVESIYGLGDSITAAEDDAALGIHDGGHFQRAFINYPKAWGAIGGETLQQVLDLKNFFVRWEVAKYATVIFDGHGRNDLAQGRTAAQLKADILTDAYRWMAQGKRYVKSTILPETGSSDGWFTVANQTLSPFNAARVEVNQWLRDTGPTGFVAQAEAAVAALDVRGDAMVVNTCRDLECNASGVLANDGGYVLPATTSFDTGTASQTGTALLTDSSKSWTPTSVGTPGFRGLSVAIIGGTGAGQSRGILWNSATTITPAYAFSPSLDATSQYRIMDAIGFTGTPHPHTRGHVLAAQAYDADAIMAPPA